MICYHLLVLVLTNLIHYSINVKFLGYISKYMCALNLDLAFLKHICYNCTTFFHVSTVRSQTSWLVSNNLTLKNIKRIMYFTKMVKEKCLRSGKLSVAQSA